MNDIESILWLDDMRRPQAKWIRWVKNYDEFVAALADGPYDLISFDHDLSLEHYPFVDGQLTATIPYELYTEKTGKSCAEYVVEHRIPVKWWQVHSMNPAGKENIRTVLQAYRPGAEVEVKVHYRVMDATPAVR